MGHLISGGKTRLAIVLVFGLAFAIELASVATLSATHALSPAYQVKLLVHLLKIYAVPFSVIAAGMFASRKLSKPVAGATFWFGMALCGIWNLLLVGLCVQFAWPPYSDSGDAYGTLVESLDNVTGTATFLITGALTFFFSKPA